MGFTVNKTWAEVGFPGAKGPRRWDFAWGRRGAGGGGGAGGRGHGGGARAAGVVRPAPAGITPANPPDGGSPPVVEMSLASLVAAIVDGVMNTELARLMALAIAGHHAEVEAWARPRAERGDPDGQFLLGFLPSAGACTDAASAREWLHRAAAQDHPEALYALSRIDGSHSRWHSRTPINDTMRARMRRAAQLGSADAQHDLGTLLSSGHGGFPKDEVEARGWQERAARAGHLRAQVSIGRMCLRGEGGPSDPVEGLAWLEKAAATEISSDLWAPGVVSDAARLLKVVYTRGLLGVTPDPTKAAAADARLLAAGALRERARAADDCAVGLDAEGQRVTRPFAFANPDEARACSQSTWRPSVAGAVRRCSPISTETSLPDCADYPDWNTRPRFTCSGPTSQTGSCLSLGQSRTSDGSPTIALGVLFRCARRDRR